MNALDPVFRMVLTASAQAAVIACAVILLQGTLGRRLGVRWQYALWLVVLARLLMPWTPGSSVSVWNVAERFFTAKPAPAPAPEPLPVVSFEAPISIAAPVELPAWPAPVSVKPAPFAVGDAVRWLTGHAGILWLAGALGVFFAVVLRAALFARRMRSARPVEGERVERVLADCRARIAVRGAPRVFETPLVPVPVLFGLARQRIILPEGLAARLSDRQLAFVLLHELAHVRRYDLAMNWLMAFAQCAHWFNPFVWLSLARMRADREMAADALVVDSARPGDALDYGRTLVSLLEGLARRRPSFVALGILERRSRLKRRIAMLADYKPGTVRTTLLGLVALLALAAVTLTAAQEQTPQPAPSAQAAPEGYVRTQRANESADGPSAARKAELENSAKERMEAFEEARRLSRSPVAQREAQARLKAARLESTAASTARGPLSQDERDALVEARSKQREEAWIEAMERRRVSALRGHDAAPPRIESTALQALADRCGDDVQNLPHLMARFRVTAEQLEMDIAYLTGLLYEISSERPGGPSGTALMDVRDKLPEVADDIDNAKRYLEYLSVLATLSAEGARKHTGSLEPLYRDAQKQVNELRPVYEDATAALARVRARLKELRSDTVGRVPSTAVAPAGQPPQPESPESQEVRRKLEKRLAHFDFVGQSLEAVVTFLRFAGEVNIVVSSSVPLDHPVTLQLADASIAVILTAVTRDAGVEWTVRDNYVFVGTPDDMKALRKAAQARAAEAPRPGGSPETEEVRRKLTRRLASFDFVNQPLEAAVTFLRFAGDFNVVLRPSVPKDRLITVQMADAAISSILDVVTRRADADWTVIDNYVFIGSPDEVRKAPAAASEAVSAPADVSISPADIGTENRADDAGSRPSIDELEALDAEITSRLSRSGVSPESRRAVRAGWDEFRKAHLDPGSARNDQVLGDVKDLDDYVGSYGLVYNAPGEEGRKVRPGALVVEKDAAGRFFVVMGGRKLPAVAANGAITSTTGDVVVPPGDTGERYLEMFMVVGWKGKYYLASPRDWTGALASFGDPAAASRELVREAAGSPGV